MTRIILKGINAIQTIFGAYAATVGNKVITIEGDDKDSLPQTIIQMEEDEPECVATMGELLNEKSKRCYYFLDHRKIKNKLWRIMYDFTSNGPLPQTTSKPCWWCRHSFSTTPIGAPIKYNSHKISGVEKERYEEKAGGVGAGTGTNDFFETTGLFCSFPCCKAYILDQRGSIRFKESLSLLSLLFTRLYGVIEPDFPSAPTWKLLKDYGGHMTIQQFRQAFGVLEYTSTVNTRRPYMYSSSEYIKEKKIRLKRDG
jgi:hypothetical protein